MPPGLQFGRAFGALGRQGGERAIQSILSNYRGVRVPGILKTDIPEVLVRLGPAAVPLGKMPFHAGETAAIYRQPVEILERHGRLEEINPALPGSSCNAHSKST